MPPSTQFQSKNRYRFKKHLGSGGSAEIYLYSRQSKGLPAQEVVLKVLKAVNDSSIAELINDGQNLSRLKHPHILATFGYEKVGRRKFALVLEHVPGMSLNKLIHSIREADRADLASYILGILIQALTAAHEQGIIHGDISARNILVSNAGQIKLADFGLARVKSKPKVAKNIKGSIDYMAPERWKDMPSSEAADVFALGVLACEILLGRLGLWKKSVERGETPVCEFLTKGEWQRFPLWKEFFQKTLTLSPYDRVSASKLAEVVPKPSLSFLECRKLLSQYITSKENVETSTTITIQKTEAFKPERSMRRSLFAHFYSVLLSLLLFPPNARINPEVQRTLRPALMTLTSRPWGRVFIDRQFKGYTPVVRFPLTSGTHEVVWRSPAGFEIRRTLVTFDSVREPRHIHYKILMTSPGHVLTKPFLIF